MCGLAGIWLRDGGLVDCQVLTRMLRRLRHRGPDGEGVWTERNFGLAHCRLAIVDASPVSSQPMENRSQTLVLAYNGEIHNFPELRRDLELEGVSFRTRGDTEVVLSAFERWGEACFEKFNGMWAIALWDRRTHRLLLCRDRFGIKPLFYSIRGSRVAFASEAKAIIAAFPEEAAPNHRELAAVLLGGSPDSGSATCFANIQAVDPGTFVWIGAGECSTPRSFWSFKPGNIDNRRPDCAEQFRELLRDSVRIRLRGDCPVGVAVSGGLDSSSVARLAAQLDSRPLHCFSLRYQNHPRVDESRYAALVTDGSDRLTLHWVTLEPQELLPAVEDIVSAHDSLPPVRGRLGLWAIFREARESVRVVLNGEGGDELLAGYPRYLFPYALDLISGRARRPGWRDLRQLLAFFGTPGWRLWLLEVARPIVKRSSLLAFTEHSFMTRDFLAYARDLDPRMFQYTFLRHRGMPRPFRSHLNNTLWQEFRFSSIPELVRSEDALGMAVSVESRSPFLDHRLVEFCFTLGADEKIANGWTKNLLREAMRDVLPEPIRQRRDKKGIPAPVHEYLVFPANFRRIRDRLTKGNAVDLGIFDRTGMDKMLARFQGSHTRTGTLSPVVWRCLCFEVWLAHVRGLTENALQLG